jgi:mRNA interferase MazF
MIREGHVVLFAFPQTDQKAGNLRPALVVRRLPGGRDDWLVCMISTRLQQRIDGFDELIVQEDTDFAASGLRTSSVIRVSRLAVVAAEVLQGSIGLLGPDRMRVVRTRLADWILGKIPR